MSLKEEIVQKVNPKVYLKYFQEESNEKIIRFGFINGEFLPDSNSYILSKYKNEVQVSTREDYLMYFKSFIGVPPTVFRDKVIEDSGWLESKFSQLGIENNSDNRRFLNQISKMLCGEFSVEAKDSVFYLIESSNDLEVFLKQNA